jgi:HEAT repeat protein
MEPDARETLISGLRSSDEEQRRQAMVSLKADLSEDDLQWLEIPLSDESWRVRKEAIEGLSGLNPTPGLISRLIPLMDPSREVTLRNSVVEVLEGMGRDAATLIAGHLSIDQPDVRKFLVDILGNIADPSAIPDLVRMLDDPEDNIQAAAAESLASIGDSASSRALIDSLEEADDWVAFSILSALARLKNAEALPIFFNYLDNRLLANPAIHGIGRIGSLDDGSRLLEILPALPRGAAKAVFLTAGLICRRALVEGVQEGLEPFTGKVADAADDQVVGFMADQLAVTDNLEDKHGYLAALSMIGGQRALEAALSMVEDESMEWDVNMALYRFAERDATTLTALLENQDALIRRRALQVLARLGDTDLLQDISPMLKDESGHVRKDAAQAVSSLGDSDSIDPLLDLLSDEYRDVSEASAEALVRLGRKYPDSLSKKIVPLLTESQPEVKALLIQVIGQVDISGHLKLLLGALQDAEPVVRAAAVGGLKGTGDPSAVSAVINSLTDESPDVRVEAAMALEILKPPGAAEPLRATLFDQDPWVRAAAVSALSAHPDMKPDDLSDLMLGDDLMIKTSVVEALGQRSAEGHEEVIDILEDAFTKEVVEIRRSICRVLGKVPGKRSLTLLLQATRDDDASVRIFAAHSIMDLGDEGALQTLMDMVESDSDRTVRDTIRSLMESRNPDAF